MSKRLVVLPWSCSMSGACCRAVSKVVMSREERQLIIETVGPEKAATLTWVEWPKNDKVALQAAPCPLLRTDNLCSVHAVKPYNCRRWGCFRPDVTTEALEPDHGFLGSPCVRERYAESAGVRKQMRTMQYHAQQWARAHGWTGHET